MKNIVKIFAALMLSSIMALNSFAGAWKSDAQGWYFIKDDGSKYANAWEWIDGNQDGWAECYYFDGNGYCLVNTTTPDGCSVNSNGAWIVNGVVQEKKLETASQATNGNQTVAVQNTTTAQTGNQQNTTATVWLSATGSKYHRINNCGRMSPNKATEVSLEEAQRRGISPCSKCF